MARKKVEEIRQQVLPKILLGAPQHESKLYAFPQYISALSALTYPRTHLDILLIDNTDDGGNFFSHWRTAIPMEHFRPDNENFCQRIAHGLEILRERTLAGGYDFYLNLETDMVAPPNLVEYMLRLARDLPDDEGRPANGKPADWLNHAYRQRVDDKWWIDGGLGCSLFSRHLLENENWRDMPLSRTCDGAFWQKIFEKAKAGEYRVCHFRGEIELNHLADPEERPRVW